MQFSEVYLKEVANCYHCGEACDSGNITAQGRHFCFWGCKTVYGILNENNLCDYYEIDKTPGVSQKKLGNAAQSRYSYLDDNLVINQLVSFSDGNISVVTSILHSVSQNFI